MAISPRGIHDVYCTIALLLDVCQNAFSVYQNSNYEAMHDHQVWILYKLLVILWKFPLNTFFCLYTYLSLMGYVGCWRWNLPKGNRSRAIEQREHHADHLGHERATPKREWVWGSILIREIRLNVILGNIYGGIWIVIYHK